MKSILLTAAGLLVFLAGCAQSPSGPAEQAPATELVYRTGSHIPVRQAPMTQEEKDKQTEESKRALDVIQRGGPQPMKTP